MKDYLILKYEKKRWYVHPSEAALRNGNSSHRSSSQSPPMAILKQSPYLFPRQGDIVKPKSPALPTSLSAPPPTAQPTALLFDPFDDDFGSMTMPKVAGNSNAAPNPFQQPMAIPKSATAPIGFLAQHAGAGLVPQPANGRETRFDAWMGQETAKSADKYSALAELDELFHEPKKSHGKKTLIEIVSLRLQIYFFSYGYDPQGI